ncbi:MAG: type I-E CRISPR-associated protein Cas5/CasD [Verrucomicrobiales bacterium]
MKPDHAMAILLDGPMQAWGSSSKFQRRETESFPTKSGVIGLLAAALGIDKHTEDEVSRLEILRTLKFSVYRVQPENSTATPARLVDFHTVGGGWHDDWQADKNNLRAKLQVSCKAGDGSPFGTVITHRTYLVDMRFIAVLEGELNVLQNCGEALKNPVWGCWLGRKACIPSSLFLPTLAPTREAALSGLSEKLHTTSLQAWTIMEGLEQADHESEGAWFQNDQPVSFGSRDFEPRPIRRIL